MAPQKRARAGPTAFSALRTCFLVFVVFFAALPAYEIFVRPYLMAPWLDARPRARQNKDSLPAHTPLPESGSSDSPPSQIAQVQISPALGDRQDASRPQRERPESFQPQPPRRKSLCPGQRRDPELHSPESLAKPVEMVTLIHIPRTGGTTAEICTTQEEHGVHRWGALNPVLHNGGKRTLINNKTGAKCYGQHVPPNVIDFYDGKDTFCVVRDPFARMISIYGYRNTMFSKEEHPCTAEMLNVRLSQWLVKVRGNAKQKPAHYLHDCHMLPQSAWVYGWDPNASVVIRSMKSCNHILQFKNLVSEFNELMTRKGYPYRMGSKKQMSSATACADLKKSDLMEETKALIREVYSVDFDMLGFPTE